jgi:hypothetical protein
MAGAQAKNTLTGNSIRTCVVMSIFMEKQKTGISSIIRGITANVPPAQEDFSFAPALPAVTSEKPSCPYLLSYYKNSVLQKYHIISGPAENTAKINSACS